MKRHTLAGPAVLAGAILFLVSSAAAQLPSGTRYAASSYREKAGNAIVALDARGAVSSILPLPRAVAPASIAMDNRNEDLLVWDHNLLHRCDVQSGAINATTLVGPNLTWGALDEDGGMVWTTSKGLLLKANDLACTKLYTVTWKPSYVFNSVAWYGSTGEWVVAGYDTLGRAWKLLYFNAYGTVSRTLTGLPSLTGLDWSPWSGDLYASYDTSGGGVIRIDARGTMTTIHLPSVPARQHLNSVEVREQPRELLVCAEAGTAPQHITLVDPATGGLTSLHTSSGVFGPSDVALVRARPLWALNAWSVGKTGFLSVNFGPALAGKYYQVALSLGHAPGIPLAGVGTVHLNPDALFFTSMLVGPPVFSHFSGTLDSRGRASPGPEARVPDLAKLIGVRLYGGAVAFDARRILAISNCWGATLRWT